jgi:hypothetical protein
MNEQLSSAHLRVHLPWSVIVAIAAFGLEELCDGWKPAPAIAFTTG